MAQNKSNSDGAPQTGNTGKSKSNSENATSNAIDGNAMTGRMAPSPAPQPKTQAAPLLKAAPSFRPKPVKMLEPPAEPKNLEPIKDNKIERPIRSRPLPTPFSMPRPRRPR